jgi:ABC-2 type transport system permease protein
VPKAQRPKDLKPQQRRGRVDLDVIIAADVDLAAGFRSMQSSDLRELQFDNAAFLLNALDSLAGDEALIPVRSRRPAFRTLTRIERRRAVFDRKLLEEVAQARREQERALEEARERMEKRLEAIAAREELTEAEREERRQRVAAIEQRWLEGERRRIEADADERIRLARTERDRHVRAIRQRVRLWALLLPPLPPLLVGLGVLVWQFRRERRSMPRQRQVQA